MQCENCHAELSPDVTVCPKCGTPVRPASEGEAGEGPVLQTILGFESTTDIQEQLKSMVDEYGIGLIVKRDPRFIALMRDYLPEHDRERKLLIRMIFQNVLINMLRAENETVAVQKAKNYMLEDFFLSPNAAEFVLACYTYMIGWHYESPLREKEPEEIEKEEEERKRRGPVFIDANVYAPLDAIRHRLSGNIAISEGYTKIDNFCFEGFGFLKTVKLPSTLLGIGDYAFSSCKRLRGIDIPPTVKVIGKGAFSQCTKLAVVKIPEGIHEIADNTFELCTSLEVVEIPATVSSIGSGAFQGCEMLKKLFIPESVKFIEDKAFAFCENLTIHCYKNSYVHKYCLTNDLKVETVNTGISLRSRKKSVEDDD
ncbi:MAG: leucine-rich repeat protein [Ruminococcus sp.]|nr:leucine-rich repeat protein [Ruminococcus sp.]